VLPVAEMVRVCRERDVAVLVDGAHVPGNVALDISSVAADWYVANLHKWYFVPRGCGFLWAAPDRARRTRSERSLLGYQAGISAQLRMDGNARSKRMSIDSDSLRLHGQIWRREGPGP
jgi:isopenicillin-N epimerase